MSKPRNPNGLGPVFMALRDVAKLGTKEERRKELLDRLDHVWDAALARTYTTKSGVENANPDFATAKSVVEVADDMLNRDDDKAKPKGRLGELRMFDKKAAG